MTNGWCPNCCHDNAAWKMQRPVSIGVARNRNFPSRAHNELARLEFSVPQQALAAIALTTTNSEVAAAESKYR
jgi:hypothetical protein